MWIHTGKFKMREIPKREFMFLTPGDEELAEKTVDKAIDVMAKLAGLNKL